MYLNLCYANTGGTGCGTHKVSVSVKTPSGKTTGSTWWNRDSLPNGKARQMMDYKFTASETGTYKVTIKLDSGGAISESNESDNTKTISFKVSAKKLKLESSSKTFAPSSASGKVKVKSNVSWKAKSSVSWLKVKTASGKGNGTVSYSVKANKGSKRTGKITVTGGGYKRTFKVTQSGKASSGATLSFSASGGSKTAVFSLSEIGSVSSMSPTVSATWLSASMRLQTSSGQGTLTFSIWAAENTSSSSRSGTVSAVVNGKTYTVNVTQSGKSSKAVPKAKTAVQIAGQAAGQAAGQVWVTTSDGSDGSAVVDGDEETGWGPSGAAGGWVALTFEEPRSIGGVVVKGDGLPEDLRVLVSEDGDDWSEEGSDAASYLWVLLPDEGGTPTVTEIVTEP